MFKKIQNNNNNTVWKLQPSHLDLEVAGLTIIPSCLSIQRENWM